jgi:hypothetical protein
MKDIHSLQKTHLLGKISVLTRTYNILDFFAELQATAQKFEKQYLA